MKEHTLYRRDFLGLIGASGAAALACFPASSPPPGGPAAPAAPARQTPSARPAWEEEWEKTIAAAKQEGKFTLASLAGTGYARWTQDFEKAFPGIKAEIQQFASMVQFNRRMIDEQKAGVYAWDTFMSASPITLNQLRPEGTLAPLRPLIVQRPEVTNDANWAGGFESGWVDKAKELGYVVALQIPALFAVNTDMVKEGEIKTVQDLLDPKWRGKIIAADVQQGGTFSPMHGLRMAQGEDVVKRLLVDQQVTFTGEPRQLAEQLIRGQQAMAIGLTKIVLKPFAEEGIAKNIKFVDIPDMTITTSTSVLWFAKRAPSPNAAKLFVNWALTKEGQMSFSKNVEVNSRRSDVPVFDPDEVQKPGRKYVPVGPGEDSIAEVGKTQEFLTKLIKG